MKKIVILIVLIILIALGSLLLLSQGKTPQALIFGGPTPTPVLPRYSSSIDYSNIFTDQKTQEQVVGSLTSPTSQTTQGNYSVFSFTQADSQTVLYTQNKKAVYVETTQTNENTTYKDFKSAHPGVQEYTLYDQQGLSLVGFEWRVFPDQGVAYLTNIHNGFVMKTIYFPHMSYDAFTATAAKDFSLQTKSGDMPDTVE